MILYDLHLGGVIPLRVAIFARRSLPSLTIAPNCDDDDVDDDDDDDDDGDDCLRR